jgi:hypothetical protein
MGPFAVILGIFGPLLVLATVTIWTFKTRMLVEGDVVTARKSILGIRCIWTFPFSEVS